MQENIINNFKTDKKIMRKRISDIFCGYDNNDRRNNNYNNGPMGNRSEQRPEIAEQQPEASKSLFGKCKDHVTNNKTTYAAAGGILAGVAIAFGAEKVVDCFRKKEESKPEPANKKEQEDNKEDSAKKEGQFEEVK